jgi:hypothetical protein
MLVVQMLQVAAVRNATAVDIIILILSRRNPLTETNKHSPSLHLRRISTTTLINDLRN